MNNLFIFLVIVFTGLYFDIFNIFKYSLISSILHETGHILAYRICLKKWPDIKISVFGFTMKNNILYSKYYPLILISGPVVNFIISILCYYYLNKSFTLNCFMFCVINAVIFVLNILPLYYLDGGQLLFCFSSIYRNNYIKISCFTIILFCVMVIYFTGFDVPIMLFSVYFIINTINDI